MTSTFIILLQLSTNYSSDIANRYKVIFFTKPFTDKNETNITEIEYLRVEEHKIETQKIKDHKIKDQGMEDHKIEDQMWKIIK